MRNEPKPGSTLELILGKRLGEVCFVLDYTTFQFGDLGLAALAAPVIVEGERVVSRDHPGYRDALCSQIERTVISVSETNEKLEIALTGGTMLIVPLDAPYPPGPEMATLSGRGMFFRAWLRSLGSAKSLPPIERSHSVFDNAPVGSERGETIYEVEPAEAQDERATPNTKGGSALDLISRRRLDSVCFRPGRVTLQFKNIWLRALAAPIVIQSGKISQQGSPDYMDALCSQIWRTVIAVSETRESLEITLTDSTKIVVPLDAPYPPGSEMAVLSGKETIKTWLRPESG